jgi:uncharacterized protein (TIGR02453 family)
MPREPIPSVALLKEIPKFEGFPVEGRRFLAGLAIHNDKRYFDANREAYERHVLGPMRAFVMEAGQRLRARVPRLVADPRVGGSLFRIARDTRFSSDKSPYKTWAAARLWDGSGPKERSASFYVQVDAEETYVGGGIYLFEDDQLARYREALSDPKRLKALHRALAKIEGLELGGEVLKRMPRGFDEDHPAGDLLRHKGLYAGTGLDARTARSARLVERAVAVYEAMVPLHEWLVRNVVVGGA